LSGDRPSSGCLRPVDVDLEDGKVRVAFVSSPPDLELGLVLPAQRPVQGMAAGLRGTQHNGGDISIIRPSEVCVRAMLYGTPGGGGSVSTPS
jgi:hypothetical protein